MECNQVGCIYWSTRLKNKIEILEPQYFLLMPPSTSAELHFRREMFPLNFPSYDRLSEITVFENQEHIKCVVSKISYSAGKSKY